MLKATRKNAELGKPVAKWVETRKEKVKIDAHERMKQQKKEREARHTRFHQGLESLELQRRSPGYYTSRKYWHTDYIIPGLPKRYQQYSAETLMQACGVRDNWISGGQVIQIPHTEERDPAAIHCLAGGTIQHIGNDPVELAALHCLLIINCPGACRDFRDDTVEKYDTYLPVDLIHHIWYLLELDSLVEAQIKAWDHLDYDLLPEEEEPIDRQQPFEQFIEPNWLPDPPPTEEDRAVAQWGHWGYDQPRQPQVQGPYGVWI